jgi:putative transposon-encoded protein
MQGTFRNEQNMLLKNQVKPVGNGANQKCPKYKAPE